MSNFITWVNQYLQSSFTATIIPTPQVAAVLLFVAVMSLLLFLVYRLVSHRALYNKSFNICIAILPFFISTIILSLQSNIVITLGTIGALAIIRFRTAIKDPVDMVYLLWAVHLGIMAGCQLFMMFVLTSIFVTIFLLVFENLRLGKASYTLIVNCGAPVEKELTAAISSFAKRVRIKSRNFTSSGVDYVLNLSVRNPQALTAALSELKDVRRFSLIEYDSEDVM